MGLAEHPGGSKIPEFEKYLKELRLRLRLKPEQSDEVVEELRGHLLQEYEDRCRLGSAPARAIMESLDELGTCDHLAEQLTTANRWTQLQARNEWLVLAGICILLTLVAAYRWWPQPRDLTVQLPGWNWVAPTRPTPPVAQPRVGTAETIRKMEDAIGRATPRLPLKEFLQQTLSDNGLAFRVHPSVNARSRDDGTLEVDAWPYPAARLRTALDLSLERHQLGWTVEDGIVIVGDLEETAGRHYRQNYRVNLESTESPELIETLKKMAGPGTWNGNSRRNQGRGEMATLNDLLIVRNRREIHQEVNYLLNRLGVAWDATSPTTAVFSNGKGANQ